MTSHEFLVVGSGATGAMAAQTLLEGGARVLMIDGGQADPEYAATVPELPFVELRRRDDEQRRYFLGEEFEGAMQLSTAAGAQLTPPRRFVVAGVERFLPLRSASFFPIESLALGGLGSAWGLGCNVFSEAELLRASLPPAAMTAAYGVVAGRVGISGEADDARPYTFGTIDGIDPATPLDPTAAVLHRRYAARRAQMQRAGFYLGRPALALLTRERAERHATSLRDMDFYSDAERAAWRPWITIERLKRSPNFAYAGNLLATRFEATDGSVELFALDMRTLEERRFSCRRLVLAAGTLGTSRIVLRSQGGDARLPLLCNAYTYIPCVVPGRAGKSMPDANLGLAQLQLFHDAGAAGADVAQASIYTYRSLLLFRLLREIPLAIADGARLARFLISGLLIAGIHHPADYSEHKRLWLEADSGSPTRDRLGAEYAFTHEELRAYERRERAYERALFQLGAWPVRRIRPPAGASIHYAGTLLRDRGDPRYRLSPDGRLGETRGVYVADGSGFTYLPAKGLTLTLMANAHRVALGLLGATPAARP
ncbi:MAG TPA: hypothetical protein VMH02_01175 [Verrucomicrobiae bacterium]|nr:hypothetical protein [Verrucomicrobiae bacterium]